MGGPAHLWVIIGRSVLGGGGRSSFSEEERKQHAGPSFLCACSTFNPGVVGEHHEDRSFRWFGGSWGLDCHTPGRCKAASQPLSSDLVSQEPSPSERPDRTGRYLQNLQFSVDDHLIYENKC